MNIYGNLTVYDITFEKLDFIRDAEKIKTIVELALKNRYACSFEFEEVISESNN